MSWAGRRCEYDMEDVDGVKCFRAYRSSSVGLIGTITAVTRVQGSGSDVDTYTPEYPIEGEYIFVDPSATEGQILHTKGKLLANDIEVGAIRYIETTGEGGGLVVTIAGTDI